MDHPDSEASVGDHGELGSFLLFVVASSLFE
jgi:hypothetical protein